MKRPIYICFLLYLLASGLVAQAPYHITLVSDDANEGTRFFENRIKTEIEALLGNRFTLSFEMVRTNGDPDSLTYAIDQAYASETDAIVGMGLIACDLIAKRGNHNKPTVLTFILDNELQEIPMTPEGTSGIQNLVYIQSPFDIKRDLETLYEFVPYDNLAIINAEGLSDREFKAYFEKTLSFCDATFEELSVADFPTAQQLLSNLPAEAEAVYLLPVIGDLPEIELRNLLEGLAERGLPVLSLLSSPALELGAYAAYENDGNLERIPRRTAINLLKIIDGQAPESLPVGMDHFTENLVINMKTVKATGLYPNWETLAKGILINVTEVDQTNRAITLQSAIAEGLDRNLGLKIATKEVRIVEKDVAIAQSNYLPQVDASATVLALDENSVRNSFGTRAFYNTSATASLSQLIISEP
ncbi:MAG: TolC family protein, partial [Bacteroidota bacterium]